MVDPDSSELKKFCEDPVQTLAKVHEWVGLPLESGIVQWTMRQTGSWSLVREIVLMPMEAWQQALVRVRVVVMGGVIISPEKLDEVRASKQDPDYNGDEERALTALELGRLASLRRIARLVVGWPGDEKEDYEEIKKGDSWSQLRGNGTQVDLTQQDQGDEAVRGMEQHISRLADLIAKKDKESPRKVKMANTIDQADDSEVTPMDIEDVRKVIEAFTVANDGIPPEEDEEADAGQLQGLKVKLEADVAPYADFSIFRPYGLRLQRALKFAAQQWDPSSNSFKPKEIPGPANICEWRRCWKVLVFSMLALKAATRARMGKYAAKIEALTEKYGNLGGEGKGWWLVAQGDIRCRGERFEKIRRGLQVKYNRDKASGMADEDIDYFNPKMPWDGVFLAAAQDKDFWTEQVTESAFLYATRLQSISQLTDPGHHVDTENNQGKGNGGGKSGKRKRGNGGTTGGGGQGNGQQGGGQGNGGPGKGKGFKGQWWQGQNNNNGYGKGGGKGSKGKKRFKGNPGGKGGSSGQVCFAWNRDAEGCPTPCPNGRKHECEFCGSKDHKGKDCA